MLIAITGATLDLIFAMFLEGLTKKSQRKTCGIWIVLRIDKPCDCNNLHVNTNHWMLARFSERRRRNDQGVIMAAIARRSVS